MFAAFTSKCTRLMYFLLFLGVAVTLGSQMGWAQATGLATLSGTVTDPSGSVIPGVSVTATNTNTGVTYRSQTNAQGVYYIGALPVGPYKIAAKKTGFKQWTRTVQLQVSQSANVDFQMQVGSTTTVVQVTGAPPILSTTGSSVRDVKDYQRINQLPLNGRSVGTLFNLTPGVEGGGIVPLQPDVQDVQEFSIHTSGTALRNKTQRPSSLVAVQPF